MIKTGLTVLLCCLLFACSESAQVVKPSLPVDFEDSDSCHLCGMMITAYPGPKGQALEKEVKQVRKFCATSDMIQWYLKAADRDKITEMYVHDMSKTPWNNPDDSHLIPVENAYFVIGSKKNGSMGPTLATISELELANDFVSEYGGRVLLFDQLIEELTTEN